MNNLKYILIGIAALVLAFGLGYFEAPDKIKTVEKIVEIEKKTTEEHKKTTKEYDPNTGKIIKETDESGTKVTDSNTTKVDKETTKEKTTKTYALKAGVAKVLNNTDKPFPRLGAEVRLPFFSSWLGAEVDATLSSPSVAGYLRVEF